MTNCYVSTVTSVIHLTHWVQSSNNVGSGTKYRRSCRRIAVLECTQASKCHFHCRYQGKERLWTSWPWIFWESNDTSSN
ncbi:hypothetical protein T4D_16443 [Trichinella pseudospiralis]|uniref:Uncharacterized protein n=1 Tax=Trichinella pseudospiralis TaxID=6337 RepID=A0A0V1G1Q3_TRIPS|nr:hypothetical protein T4D_16443 [Trichinella pseudospiralis]